MEVILSSTQVEFQQVIYVQLLSFQSTLQINIFKTKIAL